LGLQVRQAVEVLIQSLDRADQDHGRKLLAQIPETVLYEAALAVMMRLVFLFSAEERELLLLGDPMYDQHYALSTLVAQLQEAADEYGEEVLERRLDAWCRLLSTFRAVFGGVQHDRMKLPAYAGNLFNPDRFPFLEGRKPDTTWKNTPATALPVNNRTVLHLLRSLQYLEMQGEARRLSFRSLDIEQIGHVYEGLLDHTAKRAAEPVLGLAGAKGKEPEVPLAEMERLKAKGQNALVEFLKEETGRSESALRRAMEQTLEAADANKLRAVCGNDEALFRQIHPFAGLLRNDSFDRPVVIRKGSVYVTSGTDRRSSGTHYTPRSLTEPVVQYTLEPLVYDGPAEGKPKEEWKLRSAREILELKICDMACGSGAFLVQACRYLSELLVEAWEQAEERLSGEVRITPYGEPSRGLASEQPIPEDTQERLVYARRLIAQRCLYGVDKNPLAVEMAKLSLWLLTLAKDKPFTFLDHSIRCGDSLVGISSVDQLLRFSLSDDAPIRPIFQQQRQQIENRLNATKMLRRQIEDMPSNTPQDVERKTLMLKNADEQTRRLTYAADLLLAASWKPMSDADREAALNSTLVEAEFKFKDSPVKQLDSEAHNRLREVAIERRFHWPLEFPEVFTDKNGFDAIIGNPPFMGGQKISGAFGARYRDYLVNQIAGGRRGSADICAYFFLRAHHLLTIPGQVGFLATNTIAQGESREVGLDHLVQQECVVPRAIPSRKWPGLATVEVAQVWLRKGGWAGPYHIDDVPCEGITSSLTTPGTVVGSPRPLAANASKSFQGNIVLGMGFVLESQEAQSLIETSDRNNEVVVPYLNGEDLNSRPDQSPSRWVIQFDERAEEDARQYADVWRVVEQRVKPERLTKDAKKYPRMVHEWWKHWNNRRELREAITGLTRVLVRARVSDTHAFVFVPASYVFADQLVVLAHDSAGYFAVVQSELHNWWYRPLTSSLRTDVRYSPTDCFETFPFPTNVEPLEGIGEQYHDYRRQLMASRSEGLTKTYRRFHDQRERSADIEGLRRLHVELDAAVLQSYGWNITLDHNFHLTKLGQRFTISERARREVFDHLLRLNHSLAEEQPKAKGRKGGHAGLKRERRKSNENNDGPRLF
jgi:hypothetical protein